MNSSSDTPDASQETVTTIPAPVENPARSRWGLFALIFALIFLSGGLRFWRDRQFQSLERESTKSPFPLSEFPTTLGGWQLVEGSEVPMDPEVARIAGSSDHVIRTYMNLATGESVSVLILYGLAQQVYSHNPEVCYPSAGFRSVAATQELATVRTPDGKLEAPFRKQQFAKIKAGQGIVQEVYHSFRNAGEWGPNMDRKWKAFRYHPGMYKVQVQRQLLGTASGDSRTEQLLGQIVQEIEDRLART